MYHASLRRKAKLPANNRKRSEEDEEYEVSCVTGSGKEEGDEAWKMSVRSQEEAEDRNDKSDAGYSQVGLRQDFK